MLVHLLGPVVAVLTRVATQSAAACIRGPPAHPSNDTAYSQPVEISTVDVGELKAIRGRSEKEVEADP